jgi:hypothetical protein
MASVAVVQQLEQVRKWKARRPAGIDSALDPGQACDLRFDTADGHFFSLPGFCLIASKT